MTSTGASKSVVIFEGPDGGGKSTIAQEYATRHNALYIHHGPYKQVGDGLARMFLESMLPALMGYQDVVLDRCWLSEPIYADAFREGNDRVGAERSRILDRIALRAGAVVVRCLPPWEAVRATFNGRKEEEYLDDDSQLARVYAQYDANLVGSTSLPVVDYDYTKFKGSTLASISYDLEHLIADRTVGKLHPLRVATSGNWWAEIVIVGDEFGEHKNNDAMYQTPFGSLNGMGCSLWLAAQLNAAGISESDLLWINADELKRCPEFLQWHDHKHFIALGSEAEAAIRGHQARTQATVNHPQYWKRFHSRAEYPLIPYLKDLLNATA